MKRLALFFAMSAMSMAVMAQSATSGVVEQPVEDSVENTAIAPASSTTATTQPASRDEAARKDEVADRNCLKETGSRLAPRPDSKGRKCVNATGHAYTKDDLDRTGAIDLEDALRRLDPVVH